MVLIFMLFVINLFSNQIICSSSEYKDLHEQEGSLFAVEIPKYDVTTGCCLGSYKRLVPEDAYKKILKIVHGNVDDQTEYPIQLTDFLDVEKCFVKDAVRWVPTQQKNQIDANATNKYEQIQAELQYKENSRKKIIQFPRYSAVSVLSILSNKKES